MDDYLELDLTAEAADNPTTAAGAPTESSIVTCVASITTIVSTIFQSVECTCGPCASSAE